MAKKEEIVKDEIIEETKEEIVKDEIYVVYSPVKNFVGEVAGVHFAYGKAEIRQGWVMNWFKEKGYKVVKKED